MSHDNNMKNKKSKFITYLLWLLGGVFGLHHFYLGRDLQGFLWWCSLGGYFGCGWITDIFHIEEYVASANEDEEYLLKLKNNLKKNKKPPFSAMRLFGMVIFGYLWLTVFSLAIPEDLVNGYDFRWLRVFLPFACALGVWSVGNIGHQRGKIWWPLFAAYASLPLVYVTDESTASTAMVIITSFVFDSFSKQWRPRQKAEPSILKMIATTGNKPGTL